MGTIAFPNIPQDTAMAQQSGQNAMAEYARVAALKQQTALEQQQTQGAALQNQLTQQQIKEQGVFQQLAPQFLQKDANGKVTGFDYDGMMNSALQQGVRPTTVQALQVQRAQARQQLATATKDEQANQDAISTKAIGMHEDLKGITDPQQRQQSYMNLVGFMKSHGLDVSNYPTQVPMSNDDLTHLELPLGMHAQLLKENQTAAETAASAAKAQADKFKEVNGTLYDVSGPQPKIVQPQGLDPAAWHDAVDKIVPPKGDNAALNGRTKAEIDFALQRGDMKSAQGALTAAGQQLGSIEKDVAEKTNPAIQAAELHLATAKKAAEQAIADGDPRAAAQLLVEGVVSPSQLVSSRKPAFAQQAFSAAAQMNPQWNAQKAEADFKVAGSPGNVAFFGSAKSLTDKGGTLDQLAAAGKDIPGNQLPVFNTVADAIKASTGSGPIAKYAALALGVADDYSKVMGGGQGSDTSREQALKLISAKASPEQRAASLEGIRGAVSSQTQSRIGSNAVLQKMYGGEAPAAQGGGTPQSFTVKAPNGKTYKFPDQDSADSFKKRAGIK